MDTQTAKQRLEELVRQLDSSGAEIQETEADVDEAHVADENPVDSGTELADNDREEASAEIVAAQLDRVRAALKRIDDGTYGRCVDCGREIPDARLEAMPEAERDVEHQEAYEASLAG